ncbi:hypothetical protein HFD88_001455 [Aspergillus terreus]|nr:hypothetical protein HFD88_001455 [Aspergillus terreus]
MPSVPDINPYAVLGVAKDATLADIKSAHRKLVLKCHPDKIKDESQREQAQDEFQKVQQAYELLSDETRRTKYDQKVRLAELHHEMMMSGARSPSARASSSREYRDGRIFETRAPADAGYEDDDLRYPDEPPRSTSRKFDEFSARPRTKAAPDDRRKSRSVPLNNSSSTPRATRESPRDAAKATHSDRAKYRTKERRREVYDKYERATAPPPHYGRSDDDYDDASDSSTSTVYVKMKVPSSSRRSRPSARKTKSADTPPPPPRYTAPASDDDYSDDCHKYDKLAHTARDYIHRSGGTVPIEIDSRRHHYQRSSRSPLRYREHDSPEPESSSSRRSARSKSKRSSKENVSSSRHGSYEDLDRRDSAKIPVPPPMPSAATAPGSKHARPSLQTSSRSASSYTGRRDGPAASKLYAMSQEPVPRAATTTTRLRAGIDRTDSGYSSPGTPEMVAEREPVSKSTSKRYKIPRDSPPPPPPETKTILVEPPLRPSPRHARTSAPARPHGPKPPVRSNTANYPFVAESPRASGGGSSGRRKAFGEVDYVDCPRDKVSYREIAPDHIVSSHPRYSAYDQYGPPPMMPRRQSAAYAQ